LVVLDRRIIEQAIFPRQSGVERFWILCACFIFRCEPARDLFHVLRRRQGFRPDTAFKQGLANRAIVVDVLLRDRLFVSKLFFAGMKMVISAAKSFALRMIVGAKSANGRLAGTFQCDFICWVVFSNKA
jgi:hypothetical protein